MRTVRATDPSLRQFAVRGVNAVKPGKELVVIHAGRAYNSFSRRITPRTEAQYLAHRFFDKDTIRSTSTTYWDEKDWFFFSDSDHGHYLSDMGLIPYGAEGSDPTYNDSNYTLDPEYLKSIGIELTF